MRYPQHIFTCCCFINSSVFLSIFCRFSGFTKIVVNKTLHFCNLMHKERFPFAAVHCPDIPVTSGLHVSNPSTKLDTKVVFSCRDGQTLIGSDEATCLPSSNWSSEAPTCQGGLNNAVANWSWR